MNIKPLLLAAVMLVVACLVVTPMLADFDKPDGNDSTCDNTYTREKSEKECGSFSCGSPDQIVRLPENSILYRTEGLSGNDLNAGDYVACFDLTGGAVWWDWTVITNEPESDIIPGSISDSEVPLPRQATA